MDYRQRGRAILSNVMFYETRRWSVADNVESQKAVAKPASHAKNDFEKDKFILKQLVTKDFKIKYRRSVLGVAWSVLNPLLMMVVMSIVFSTIFGQSRNGSITPEMYPLYLIVGNITFSVMSESTNQALMSIIWASSLLKKVKVHRWVFPVQKVLFSLVNFSFSLVAVALVMVWFRVVPTWHLILLPVCLLLLMCFCMGLGMMLSALAVFFRDVMHLWTVVITAWMYLTPIFWTTDYISQMAHWIQVLVVVNPMYNYLQFMRDIFLFNTVPSALTFGLCVVWAVIALAIGYTVFHKTEHKFILYI